MEKKKVLVVDDEKEVILILKGYFQAKGYQMFTALTGKEAIDVVEREPVDLVLLDMKMPGIDGVEVLKNVRTKWAAARVIVITGYAEEYEDEIRKAGGVEEILTKPVPLRELTEKVEKVLAASPQALIEDSLKDIDGIRELLAAPPLERSKERIVVKLLFVEPNPVIYRILSVHFNRRLEFNEEYRLRWAHSRTKIFEELESFRPDIVLLDINTLWAGDEIALQILDSDCKPKEVIIYGISLSDADKARIEKLGVSSQEVGFTSPKEVDRLIKLVRDIAIRYKLVGSE